MVATNGFLTKSSLLQSMNTYESLRRRPRCCLAFVTIEPARSFKFINNITYLIFFDQPGKLPAASQLSSDLKYLSFFVIIQNVSTSFLSNLSTGHLFHLLFGLVLMRLIFSACDCFSF
jgi:hypothetical protein